MNTLESKPLIVIDLGSGRYVQSKTGHEYYNLMENPHDGRYYGYCPPWGNIDINNLGADRSASKIDDVVVIYTTKLRGSNDRVIVAFADSATVHRIGIIDEKLERTIIQDGEIKHCSYSVESDILYNLESYPNKFIIEISKYNPWMFRKQRFFKGKYKELDNAIINYLKDFFERTEYLEDELYQKDIHNSDSIGKGKFNNTFDVEPQWANRGGSLSVKRNVSYARKALADYEYHCCSDNKHITFTTPKGVPYMEGHHLIPCTANNAKFYWDKFAKSIDCVENIVSLCPTCHRRIHFGSIDEKKIIIKDLYKKLYTRLMKAGLNVTEEELINLYIEK